MKKRKQTKTTAGRPTKYHEGMPDLVNEYLKMTGLEQMHLPKMCSLALYLDVNEDTLVEWGKIHPLFSAALRKLKDRQQEQLIDIGMFGGKEVNATIVKLLLQNNHGMRERNDITTNDQPLPTPIYGGKSTGLAKV